MKYGIQIVAFLLLFAGCKSSGVIVYDAGTGASFYVAKYRGQALTPIQAFKRHGFRYKVPESMAESPEDAYRFRYDHLLLDKNADYYTSSVVIAIRHYDLQSNDTLHDFAKKDQLFLRESVQPTYENGWVPAGFLERNIEYAGFQFYYTVKKMRIYQRSVYVLCDNRVHIISFSSPSKELLIREESDTFWESIRVD